MGTGREVLLLVSLTRRVNKKNFEAAKMKKKNCKNGKMIC